jgi:hypothetical protein
VSSSSINGACELHKRVLSEFPAAKRKYREAAEARRRRDAAHREAPIAPRRWNMLPAAGGNRGDELPGGQSGAGAPPIKALGAAQNTNDRLFVRSASLNCKEQPASERDDDGPVDQGKNDGVDHINLHCQARLHFRA